MWQLTGGLEIVVETTPGFVRLEFKLYDPRKHLQYDPIHTISAETNHGFVMTAHTPVVCYLFVHRHHR